MTADARMIFVDSSGAIARSIPVSTPHLITWLQHLPKPSSPWRTADVGEPILSTVITVSHHEALVATRRARTEAWKLAEGARQSEMFHFCDVIDALIATAEPVSYYSAWVIIETADID